MKTQRTSASKIGTLDQFAYWTILSAQTAQISHVSGPDCRLLLATREWWWMVENGVIYRSVQVGTMTILMLVLNWSFFFFF